MKRPFSRFIWIIALLVLLAIVAGGYYYYQNNYLDPEKIVERALRNKSKLKSYYGSLEVIPAGHDREKRHYVQIWFLAPASYRVEIFSSYLGDGPPEQVFISDGEKRWIYSPEVEDYLMVNPLAGEEISSSPYLLNAFLEELANARQVELLGLENYENRSYYLLQLIPRQVARGHAWEKVWLERRSKLPVKIQVFDEQDSLVRTITYKKIDLNPKLNEELFNIDY